MLDYYGFPAVRVRSAITRDFIWCRVSETLQSVFMDKATYYDVWHHQRVMIHGRIRYSADSEIISVLASDIRRIEPRPVSLEEIRDKDFTEGLSIGEYLDRFREGVVG
jgi:hypothetical protein